MRLYDSFFIFFLSLHLWNICSTIAQSRKIFFFIEKVSSFFQLSSINPHLHMLELECQTQQIHEGSIPWSQRKYIYNQPKLKVSSQHKNKPWKYPEKRKPGTHNKTIQSGIDLKKAIHCFALLCSTSLVILGHLGINSPIY